MEKPFPAYRGPEPFVFVCYSHNDSEKVYSDLIALNSRGLRIWYDEGIPAGTSWRAEIVAAIQNASKLLFFVSKASLQSKHCLREVDYALDHDIQIIPVYLDGSALPPELALSLSRVPGLSRSDSARYLEHLYEALQENGSFKKHWLPARKGRTRAILPSLALAAVVGGILFLLSGKQLDNDLASAFSTTSSRAANLYNEGIELTAKWALNDNLDRAIALLRESVSLDPSFALGYARLAEALRIKYALSGDRNWLDEAIVNSNLALNLNPNLAPVQVVSGRIQTTQGNYDLASTALERALAIDPNNALANEAMASLYNRLGRTADAESAYRRAISLEPNNLFILDAFGVFLYGQTRFEEAIAQWQNVIRLAPDHYSVLVNTGSALDSLGRMSEAITMYERANEIQPTYMAYSNLGAAYEGMHRYPEAIDALQKAIEIYSGDWLAWGNLAYAYSWMGGAEEEANEAFHHAIEMAESARALSPRDPYAHIDLAVYYAQTEQPDLAIQRLETAMTLAPGLGDVYASAAEVYEVIGGREQAIQYANRAVELGYPRQQLFRNPELSELLGAPEIIDEL